MRILKEALPQINNEDIKKWSKASHSEKMQILNKLLPQYGKSDLKNIIDAILFDFDNYGIDPTKNPFIELIGKFTFPLTKKHNAYLQKLTQLRSQKSVDVSKDYLTLKSLYDRNMEDFIYTVVLFDTVNDRAKLNKFFKNTTEIKESDLFVKGTNVIKPAGNKGDGTDTLYGTVESWSGKDGSNNASYKDDRFTLNQAFKAQGIKSSDQQRFKLSMWIQNSFTNITKEINLNQSDVNYYIDRINLLLKTLPEIVRLNADKAKEIKQKFSYTSINHIPKKCRLLNNIVYCKYLTIDKESNPINSYMDDNNSLDDFVIYTPTGWKEYGKYVIQAKKEHSFINKLKHKLLTTTCIEDIQNENIIAKGVLQLLDTMNISDDLMDNYDLYGDDE